MCVAFALAGFIANPEDTIFTYLVYIGFSFRRINNENVNINEKKLVLRETALQIKIVDFFKIQLQLFKMQESFKYLIMNLYFDYLFTAVKNRTRDK